MGKPEWTPKVEDECLLRVKVRGIIPAESTGMGFAFADYRTISLPSNLGMTALSDLLPAPAPDAPTVEDVLQAGAELLDDEWGKSECPWSELDSSDLAAAGCKCPEIDNVDCPDGMDIKSCWERVWKRRLFTRARQRAKERLSLGKRVGTPGDFDYLPLGGA